MSKRWDLNPEIADVINADADTPEKLSSVVTVNRPLFAPQLEGGLIALTKEPEDDIPMKDETKPSEPEKEKAK
jgi:hypothetical protein